MEHLVSTYLKYLDIPISGKYCEKLILSHPDYPSFLSISDTCNGSEFATKPSVLVKRSWAIYRCRA